MSKQLYAQAIEKFGIDSQLNILIEECSEIIKEVCKRKRGYDNTDDLAQELVDVEIMIGQMRVVFGDEMDKWKKIKLKRLKRLIENE